MTPCVHLQELTDILTVTCTRGRCRASAGGRSVLPWIADSYCENALAHPHKSTIDDSAVEVARVGSISMYCDTKVAKRGVPIYDVV